jgi:uroporphyrinogen-III synthase
VGERVLYPRSATGRDVLPEALGDAGIDVTVVDAYRTIPEREIAPDAVARLRAGNVDVLLFSSPSSVAALQSLLGPERFLIDPIPAICAGPVTAAAVREAGLRVATVSTHPGAPAMVDALSEFWNHQQRANPVTNRIEDNVRSNERIAGR